MKAVYAGSFNPLHSGHLDILLRASKLFDSVTLLIATNPSKHYLLGSTERSRYIGDWIEKMKIKNVTVDVLDKGFIGDYCREKEIGVIVKGLRNGIDLDSEMSQEFYTKQINGSVETIYLSSNMMHKELSSTAVRELTKLDYDGFKKIMSVICPMPLLSKDDYEEYLKTIYKYSTGTKV